VLISLVALEKRPAVVLTALLVLTAFTLAGIGTALAIKPEKKFKGQIVISKKRFPSRFKSDREFIRHMKKVNTHKLTAEGDEDWKFEYMAFLPERIATLKAAVTYYDITNPGQKKYINNFAFYPSDRKDKIVAGHAELSDDKFEANRKYLMVFSRGYGQKPLAKTKFVLKRKGGKKKESGVVDFTADGKEKAKERKEAKEKKEAKE
jgi:hypothetical protein